MYVSRWKKNNPSIFRAFSQEERSENRTVSTVEFEPGVEDHGKSITCRAENPNVTGLFVEKAWKIDVVCEYTLHFSLTCQFLADRKLAHDRQIAKLIAVNRIRQHDEWCITIFIDSETLPLARSPFFPTLFVLLDFTRVS